MESREAIALIIQATLVGSAAVALVLLARRPLRHAFGARATYAAWWLVPAALLALAVPSAPPGEVAAMGVRFAAPLGAATGFAGREAGFSWQPWALGAWACGAIAYALLMAVAQARFRAALGALRPHGDAWRAEHAAAGLPATVGVLVPRIVVPADFESRYDAGQRELVLAHERTHVARGDAWANLAVATLQCLCWFNPLVHVAARRFRHDQELACDAIVVARHPRLRRAYGDALVQAQCAAQASPLACHFGFGHPLRERIAMLREPIATRRRRIAGNAAVAILVSAAAFAAWATQPPIATQAAGAHGDEPVASMQIKPDPSFVGEIRMQPPKYPKEALDAGVGGTVNLIINLAADGRITGVSVENPEETDPRFANAAAKAAWDWKFKPQIKDGKPVAGRVRVPITFSPSEPKASGKG
jgi:TonB family protein